MSNVSKVSLVKGNETFHALRGTASHTRRGMHVHSRVSHTLCAIDFLDVHRLHRMVPKSVHRVGMGSELALCRAMSPWQCARQDCDAVHAFLLGGRHLFSRDSRPCGLHHVRSAHRASESSPSAGSRPIFDAHDRRNCGTIVQSRRLWHNCGTITCTALMHAAAVHPVESCSRATKGAAGYVLARSF